MNNERIYDQLVDKKAKLAVIGLGYVGLPIALEFAKKISVIGFDINKKRIGMMREGIDPSKEVAPEEFSGRDIVFTDELSVLKEASFFIVAVPTPVDQYNVPDLKPLLGASETVGKVLKPGDYVVYESTTYPGCTEEDCLPVLERTSRLKMGMIFTWAILLKGSTPETKRIRSVPSPKWSPAMTGAAWNRSQRPMSWWWMRASIALPPSKLRKPAR